MKTVRAYFFIAALGSVCVYPMAHAMTGTAVDVCTNAADKELVAAAHEDHLLPEGEAPAEEGGATVEDKNSEESEE